MSFIRKSVKRMTGYPNSDDRRCAERQYTCLDLFPDSTCSCASHMLYIRVASILGIFIKYFTFLWLNTMLKHKTIKDKFTITERLQNGVLPNQHKNMVSENLQVV
jgi:hypothetical protein